MLFNTDPTAGKKQEAGSVFKTSKAMELFPAVVLNILCEAGKLFKLILWLWSIFFNIYFHGAPALIPQMKPWHSHQKCPRAGIWFPNFECSQSKLEAKDAVDGLSLSWMLFFVFHNRHFTPKDLWYLRNFRLLNLEKSLETSWSSLLVPEVDGNYRK